MNARIDHEDIRYLRTFPDQQKAEVMEAIMARRPVNSIVMDGSNHFEKAVIKLHREGFGLIDLQRLETACATVWYRRRRALLSHIHGDVTMLLWQTPGCGDETTLINWRI